MILPLFEFLRHLPSTDTSLMFSKAAGPYLFKVKNGNTKQINEIYSKITKNAP